MIVIQMVNVMAVKRIITLFILISVMAAVAVKQVQLDQHHRLLVLLLKKVMEVPVPMIVNVIPVLVQDLTVVAVKDDLLGAQIVITVVTVQRVVPIITNITLNVMPAVMVKLVQQDPRLLRLVSLLKKVMEVPVLTTVTVPRVRVAVVIQKVVVTLLLIVVKKRWKQ